MACWASVPWEFLVQVAKLLAAAFGRIPELPIGPTGILLTVYHRLGVQALLDWVRTRLPSLKPLGNMAETCSQSQRQ